MKKINEIEGKSTIPISELNDLIEAIRNLVSEATACSLHAALPVAVILARVAVILAEITGDDNDVESAIKIAGVVGTAIAGEEKPENFEDNLDELRAEILLTHAKKFQTPSAIRKAWEAIEKMSSPSKALKSSRLANITKDPEDIRRALKEVLNVEPFSLRARLLMNLARISKNPDDLLEEAEKVINGIKPSFIKHVLSDELDELKSQGSKQMQSQSNINL